MADIHERVSSDNISGMSNSLTTGDMFNQVSAKQAGMVYRELISKIESRIEKATGKTASHNVVILDDNGREKNIFRDETKRLQNLEKEFISLVNSDIPEGFELVPVWVNSKLDQKELEETYNEFSEKVRSDFIKTVAEQNEDELKKHGFNEYAISLMKTGYILRSAFPYNIDHIMERADSSKLSTEKEADPNNIHSSDPVRKINHFNNLIMLPEKVHEFKNALKRVQLEICDGDEDNSPKYLLMLVPKKNEDGKVNYICGKQKDIGPYAIHAQSDHDVTIKTLRWLETKTHAELKNNPTCLQAIENVATEMEKKIEAARTPSETRITKVAELESFFKNENLRELYVKMYTCEHSMCKHFEKDIMEIKELIKPPVTVKSAEPGVKKKVVFIRKSSPKP